MDNKRIDYKNQIEDILESGRFHLSTIKPSDWAEENRFMDSSISPYKGPFSYKVTTYTKEIINCLSQEHTAHTVAI